MHSPLRHYSLQSDIDCCSIEVKQNECNYKSPVLLLLLQAQSMPRYNLSNRYHASLNVSPRILPRMYAGPHPRRNVQAGTISAYSPNSERRWISNHGRFRYHSTLTSCAIRLMIYSEENGLAGGALRCLAVL